METTIKRYTLFVFLLLALSIYGQEEISDVSNANVRTIQTVLPRTHQISSIEVTEMGNDLIFQGDIIIEQSSSSSNGGIGGAVTTNSNALWPNATVPYVIAANHPKRAEIERAISYLSSHTNVCIVPRTNETDYIEYIYEAGRCGASHLGKISSGGRQIIKIGNRCRNTMGSAMHETMHALGFYHEQSRDDRDTYVTIHESNITPRGLHNFDKYNQSFWHSFFPEGNNIGTYDYNSIMHYGRYAFGKLDSRGNRLETITPVSSSASIGQRDSLSTRDIASINTLYPRACTRGSNATTSDSPTTSSNNSSTPSTTINISYSVELVPQQTGMSCWAAAAAMVVGWKRQVCIDPQEIANAIGFWAQYRDGLQFSDRSLFSYWDLTLVTPPQTYTVRGFADILENGPIWTTRDIETGSSLDGGHAVVVTAMRGDGTPDGTILTIYDPWERGMRRFRASNRGSIYQQTYTEFVTQQEEFANRVIHMNNIFFVAY